MDFNSIIFHKDTLSLLSKYQQDFIRAVNTNRTQNFVLPVYPLVCLPEDYQLCIFEKNIKSVFIHPPVHIASEFYFPVEICAGQEEEKIIVKVPFAYEKNPEEINIESLVPSYSQRFPIKVRVFQFAHFFTEGNSNFIENAKWKKL